MRVLGPLDTDERRGVVTFSVEGVSAENVCRFLDCRGVALRGANHCAQPLVRAFGVEGAARASLAPYSLDADITALLDGLDVLGPGTTDDITADPCTQTQCRPLSGRFNNG